MKNKILIISIIFILLSSLFITNNVYATETTNTLIVEGYDMTDIYNYVGLDDAFFIFSNEERSAYRFYCPTDINDRAYNALGVSNNKSVIFYFDSSWNYANWYNVYDYNVNTQKFEYLYSGAMNGDLNMSFMVIVYTSKGIYNEDRTTFFVNPPVQQGAVAQKLEEVEMMKPTMKEILTLVPIMIILIASYLGLRKGLTLLKILRKM